MLVTYPDFNIFFDIHTDVSNIQWGVVISQYGKPISFYSCKLTGPQTRYAVTENELLSIVKTLKIFYRILLSQQ